MKSKPTQTFRPTTVYMYPLIVYFCYYFLTVGWVAENASKLY